MTVRMDVCRSLRPEGCADLRPGLRNGAGQNMLGPGADPGRGKEQ